MKKTILLLLLFASAFFSRAQIVLEHTYPGSATLTELALSGNKYFMMDVTTNQCKIYNTDHSIWKTINLSVPANMYLYDIKLVSETLFNSDSKVELAYIYYSYDTTYYYYSYFMKVVNENGFELLTVPGCGYLELKKMTNGDTKMVSYVYNYSIYPGTVNTLIYSLPGDLPTGGITEKPSKSPGLPYPNPAGSTVTIPYHLPDGVNEADIQILTGTGQMVQNYRVDGTFDHLQIQTDNLPAGLLLFQVKNGNETISSGKFLHQVR